MDSLQVRQLIVVRIHANAEEQACIAPVNNLVVAKLHTMLKRGGRKRSNALTSTKFD